MLDTKIKGDYAELLVAAKALSKGWGVLKPIGDRLPYDLVFDVAGKLVKIQVKSAWYQERTDTYQIKTVMTKSNRGEYKFCRYNETDFDFAIAHLQGEDSFYVLPMSFYNSFKSNIAFIGVKEHRNQPRSLPYKEAWHLIEQFVQGSVTVNIRGS
jgi:hypothetical protein